MRTYRVNKYKHSVYDSIDEIPQGIDYKADWRNAIIGDWVLADDGCIIQILRRGEMKTRRGTAKSRAYVGTCTGTFMCTPRTKMDTSKRENVWTISG